MAGWSDKDLAFGEISAFEDFMNRAKGANTHPAKLLVFSDMLKSVFGVQLQDLVPGIETKLGSKVLGVRGSADLIFSNIIFELKIDLRREEDDAKEQIPKYFQALEEKFPGMKYIAIATDCTVFKAFIPIWNNNIVTGLDEISILDTSKSSPPDSILWLDSFIFSKPKIRPSAEDLKWRFGPKSPTYWIAIKTLQDLWQRVHNEPDTKLKLDIWKRNLEIVYGKAPEEQSFIDHTYLVTLVKLIVYLRLSADNTATEERIKQALSGEYFSSYGITNLIEEDLFSWILQNSIAKDATALGRELAVELLRYDFSQIDEDFFKEIYQDVIERGQRHRIGEYYTPEWLTELTLLEAIGSWTTQKKESGNGKNGKLPSILDAYSGSGTFLSSSIRYMKNMLAKQKVSKKEALQTILTKVVGMDINPLAVIIGRANYLIALGDLLTSGMEITIPNYVSDSIRIPKVETVWEYQANERVEVFDFQVATVHIQIPTRIAKDRSMLGAVLSAFKQGIEAYKKNKDRPGAIKLLQRLTGSLVRPGELGVFQTTFELILTLIDKKEDSIWLFIINNMYAPVALAESKFDILMSNPPWIAIRYVENKSYQEFLKEQVFNYELLKTDQVKLFTQMEVATLCFRRSADIYLRSNGLISFVMPRSVLTGAMQHQPFRSFTHPKIKLERILDVEDVLPLFNVPSCVLIGTKDRDTSYPVFARRYIGSLPAKNLRLEEALKHLKLEDYQYEPPTFGGKKSVYYDMLKAGAAIYPRSFIFIDFDKHEVFGINSETPRVRTSSDVNKAAKKPWDSVMLVGNIESEFLYATLVGGDIVPFGYTRLRPVVIPTIETGERFHLLEVPEIRSRGYPNTASWFQQVQEIWESKSTPKSRTNFPQFIDSIDYQQLLSSQNPSRRFILQYAGSGTNIASCVIDRNSIASFERGNTSLKPRNFVAEKTTWFIESNNENELHYLCAVLNSAIVNLTIKPLQTRGLWGERHIHRRPFLLPIPQFSHVNDAHKRLSKLSQQCHEKVKKIDLTNTSSGRARGIAREAVPVELEEINRIVSGLLGV